MPVRYTSPSLGGQRLTYLRAGEWQAGVSLRWLKADHFFVGHDRNQALAPFGQPINLNLTSVDLSLTYALTDRLALALAVPYVRASERRTYPDLQAHRASASGVGDVNLTGNYWLGTPARHPHGNLLLGLGIKAPTGSYHKTDTFYDPSGVSQQPVNQSIQPGDGGWALLFHMEAFHQVFDRGFAYTSGFYSASLKEHTDVPAPWPPFVPWAVPDVYTARLGMAYGLMPEQGLSASLGARIDGTTMKDLFGGADDYSRHPGWAMYLEPGFSFARGPSQFTVSVPIRIAQNFMSSLVDQRNGRVIGGDLANAILYMGFQQRF